MKHAYSNIFGLVVDAAEVDHKDCEPFQIVCRECREYVFKTVRSHPNGPIHYFSHYRADPEANALCEERAKARLQNGGYSNSESEGRDQTIKLYLENFTEMVNSLPYFYPTENVTSVRSAFSRSKGACNIRSQTRHDLIEYNNTIEIVKKFAYGDQKYNEKGFFYYWDNKNEWEPQTQFARSVQVRIASDMLETLLTKPAIPAWNILFSSAWYLTTLISRNGSDMNIHAQHNKILVPVLEKACNGEDIRRELHILDQKQCGMPYLITPGTWFEKLQNDVIDSIIKILLSIDYARWSRQRKMGKAPEEISAELRIKALRDYEKQRQYIISSSIDISVPSEEQMIQAEGKKASELGDNDEQAQAQAEMHHIKPMTS